MPISSTSATLENLNNNDLSGGKKDNEPVNHNDHDESLNHSTEKCPYCDYEEHPFYLKVHVKFTHPEHYDGI